VPEELGTREALTDLIQHLVTLIQHKHLAVTETKVLISDKRVKTTRCSNNDVGMGVLILENLGIFLNGSSSIKDSSLYIRHILAEASVLIFNLVGQLASVAHDEDRGLASDRLNLLEGCKDEDGGLTETRFGLAKDIGTENCLRNANLLDCRVNRAAVR